MIQKINLFFTSHYGLYSIILIVCLILILIILRVMVITKIKDDVIAQQRPEMREKIVILRDLYEVKIFKQIVTNSKIIMLGVHGLQGQKEDFKLLSSFCKKYTISLITYDRRGIGKNSENWKFKSLGTDINDLKDVINVIKHKYPHQQLVVVGESLGATLASAAVKNNNQVAAVMIINLVTKRNLAQFSICFLFSFAVAFMFNSNIALPIYIENKEISSSHAHINNLNQRYSNRQRWSLAFLLQFKKLNKKSVANISKFKQPTLILQSADDVFSDFHQLKVNKKYWKKQHKYLFLFDGKHALMNEPNIKQIFEQAMMPWIINNVLIEKGLTNNEINT